MGAVGEDAAGGEGGDGFGHMHTAMAAPGGVAPASPPVSMMVPDYALFGEIMPYAEGFLDSLVLAHKMVKM